MSELVQGESILDGVLTLVIALIAVGLVLYLSYLFSRYLAVGAAKVNKSKNIKIVDRVVLGQDKMILIAKVGGKYYLIGSSTQSIQILTELDDKAVADISYSEKNSDNATFKNTLKGMLSKK